MPKPFSPGQVAIMLMLLACLIAPAAAAEEAPATPTAGTGIERPDLPKTRKGRQCAKQCEVFQAQCLPRCERTGQVPGNRSRTGDCSKDCKDFGSACLWTCLGKKVPTRPKEDKAPPNEGAALDDKAGPIRAETIEVR